MLTPSMSVSNWLPRPRVRLFIRWLQGICTPGVVRLRRVVTRITSGVCEQVHSILRQTLYYITPPRFLRGLCPNKSLHNMGGGWGVSVLSVSVCCKLYPFNPARRKAKYELWGECKVERVDKNLAWNARYVKGRRDPCITYSWWQKKRGRSSGG